jgi:hypothetical protein
MQAILCAFLLKAFAGHPEEDDEVAKRFRRFREATPLRNLAQLQLGKTWHCLERAATRSDFRILGPQAWFCFQVFDETLVQTLPLPYRSLNLHWQPQRHGLQATLSQHAHVSAHVRENEYPKHARELFFRAVSDSEWIVEVTAPKGLMGAASTSDPHRMVVSFLSCHVSDTSSAASTPAKDSVSP